MEFLDRTDIENDDPEVAPVLENLQGNILKGHGRDHTVHLFFSFLPGVSTERRRQTLRRIAGRVTSARQQAEQREEYLAKGTRNLSFVNLFLTAKGYAEIGIDAATLATAFPESNPGSPFPTQVRFTEGMAKFQGDLADPVIADWEPGYADPTPNAGTPQILDGMVLLANDDLVHLRLEEKSIRADLASAAEVRVTEYGRAIFNEDKSQNLEHFGYVDGRSQPTYFLEDYQAQRKKGDGVDKWDPREPLKRVLVPDALAPSGQADVSFGSYFVFRKLEQNVRGFKTREKDLAGFLGLEGDKEELAGALAVGRFEDGTPVALSDVDGSDKPVPNNFRFDEVDPAGSKCPFHAHVRKMSPRGDTKKSGSIPASDEETERGHRITRRGITYGQRDIEPKDDPSLDQLPTRGVGLLFMCFQANIDNQFAFMQRAWANNPAFARPLFLDGAAPPTGLDPVIGQPVGTLPNAQNWPSPWGSATRKDFAFESFVRLLGGEFFFSPSLSFLKSL